MNKNSEKIIKEYKKLLQDKKQEVIQCSEYFLKKNFHYRKNFKKDKISKKDIGKIYFVSGILHLPIKTRIWKRVFKKTFLKTDIEFFDTIFYVHVEKRKVNKIITNLKDSLKKTLEDKNFNQKIIIFAHSFGGILSKTAITKLPKEMQGRIILVTLGTPHTMDHGMVLEIRKYLKTPDDLKNLKVFSFGGIYDVIVPAKFSHTKNSLKVDIKSGHEGFLYTEKILEKVLSEVFAD